MNAEEKAMLKGMKEGVAIRIAELEAKVERLRVLYDRRGKRIEELAEIADGFSNQLREADEHVVELQLRIDALIG